MEQDIRVMICGHSRHGKDTASEFLLNEYGLTYTSSSLAALDSVIWPLWGKYHYETPEDCFADRNSVGNPAKWFDLIKEFNTPDEARLGRIILEDNNIYCGLRRIEELRAMDEEGLFDLSIWIDAHHRKPPQTEDSCTIGPSDCDIIICNNGTKDDLEAKLFNLFNLMLDI